MFADGPDVNSKVIEVVVGVVVGLFFCNPLELGPRLALKAKLCGNESLLKVWEDIKDKRVDEFVRL